jgi:hypothetical protein
MAAKQTLSKRRSARRWTSAAVARTKCRLTLERAMPKPSRACSTTAA